MCVMHWKSCFPSRYSPVEHACQEPEIQVS